MIRISVAGASGYAGGELLRLLLSHPEVDIAAIAAGSNAGEPVLALHPNLAQLADRHFVATSAATLGDADLVFLALPHGESAALAQQLPSSVAVVDLGADFRLSDAKAWEQFYQLPHAGNWTYGLPELDDNRLAIAASTRVANPGCYPTSVALALAPLLSRGLISTDGITVVAASGTSGAGRKPMDAQLASQVMGSMSAYGVGGVHRHTPEIEQSLSRAAGQEVTVSFTPLLAPMSRGMLSACTAQPAAGTTAAELRDALASAYEAEPFVQLLPEGYLPQTSSVYGTNAAQVQVLLDERAGRVIAICALDNLGKGAAGQAIQNANLMLGLPEGLGLTSNGVAP